LGVGIIMGIEQFVLEKGKSLFNTNSSGVIDNRLSELVLSLSQNYPISYGLFSIIIVIIVGTVFSYVRELVHYVRFDLDKKKYNFFK